MKAVPSAVSTQIAAQYSKPVILFEFDLGSLGTMRYALSSNNITFPYPGGNLYTARAFKVGNLRQTTKGQIGSFEFQVDNVKKEWTSISAAIKLDSRELTVKKIYRDALSDASYYAEEFYGHLVGEPKLDRRWCPFKAVSGSPLGRQLLLDVYEDQCIHIFGDTQCNKDGNSNLSSLTYTGTADSGSASTLTDNALTQADDYWNFGHINITIDSKTYPRKINDFDAATDTLTFDVALPIAVSNGDSYTVYKGCNQTLDTCKATVAWGPSADNKANFLGFIHIWREGNVRKGAGPSPISLRNIGNANQYDGGMGGIALGLGDIGGGSYEGTENQA